MAALEVHLIKAVQDGDINEVISLIEKGANINVFTSGRTPLAIAAHQGNVPMLELLLNCGHFKQKVERTPKKKSNKNDSSRSTSERTAVKKRKAAEGNNGYYEVIYDDKSEDSESDVNRNVSLDDAETPEGMDNLEWDMELEEDETPDYEDAWSDQYRWYAKILAKSCYVSSDLPYSCDVNLQDSVGRCAIHYAAEYGHVNAVKVLINAGCKADMGDVDSLTPLHLAANGGHLSVVETLLSSGCHVNAKTTDKLSPLHYAAARGYTEVVTALLNAGANVDSLDEGDRTPLILAVSRNIYDVAKVLVNRGARVNIEDVKGYTAMCEAVWHKSVPLVKLLLDAGAKVVPTHFLVHYAVLHRQPEMVSALLEAGALVNIRDACGDTPLITAATSSQADMVDLLLSYGAVVDQVGGSSEKTPLYCAVALSDKPCLKIIRALVEAGADIERLTWGQTPLIASLLSGKMKAAVALVALGAKVTQPVMALVKSMSSISVARAFVYSGYNITSLEPLITPPSKWPVDTSKIDGWLQHTKYNPLGLAEMCRIVVRKQAIGILPVWLSSLQLPPVITRYLIMEDLMDGDIEKEPISGQHKFSSFFFEPNWDFNSFNTEE